MPGIRAAPLCFLSRTWLWIRVLKRHGQSCDLPFVSEAQSAIVIAGATVADWAADQLPILRVQFVKILFSPDDRII